MVHLPTTAARPTEIPATGRDADRAMDVLQYGMAVFAIIVAVILGLFR